LKFIGLRKLKSSLKERRNLKRLVQEIALVAMLEKNGRINVGNAGN
jgi:hypothetical protein